MKWMATSAYVQLQAVFTDEQLMEDLGLVSVVIGHQAFPPVDGISGPDLMASLPAVVIGEGAGGDAVTYSNIVHHHQSFNVRVHVYMTFDPSKDNPVAAANDAVSRLLEELVKNPAPVSLTDGSLYSIEPGGVSGYDAEESRFWEDVGLPVVVGRFDVGVKSEPT